jgi:hypothetical protein
MDGIRPDDFIMLPPERTPDMETALSTHRENDDRETRFCHQRDMLERLDKVVGKRDN